MPVVPGGRQCERCEHRVTDTQALTEAELERVLDASETGRACVRIVREGERLRLATGLAASIVALVLAGCATPGSDPYGSVLGPQLTLIDAGAPGQIGGVIRDTAGQPIEDAFVILQSVALERERELITGPTGVYRFDELPPGTYTVQILVRKANVSKIVELGADRSAGSVVASSGARINFEISPEAMNDRVLVGMVVCEPRIRMDASSTYSSKLVWID
ncbi:carboxypeptidase-like regulatory domain-containing protein [Enhygromyxa salina]|uniref:Carboxypeptidase regulatory-like domain-containing protein n=1 Tax=Enhygromyxa salina TaxID=215803 RepID=A0A2S9YKB0_9BACT|nr:carboxypeptidase regulatory-like domain-containing protein [Enhygromyxa salina]PRQ05523.1 hypothetical protein ENSA7_45690 [Enhygromyxa salina]